MHTRSRPARHLMDLKRGISNTYSEEKTEVQKTEVEGWELYEKSGINTERLIEFLEKFITEKYKNKLIILDNAPAHKNERIREFVNRHNQLLYSVPYQHFSTAIENYFIMLNSE